MAETKKSVFETLNAVNCNEHVEKKDIGGNRSLSYLSWAWAWAEVKKRYPNAFYTIYERPDGCPYWTDGRTCWVKTGVTIEGLEHTEYLPVMDNRNNSIPLERITSFDMNKAIQRSLTKAAARHGLGLYIYAGEDLPEDEAEPKREEPKPAPKKDAKKADANALMPGGTDYNKVVAAYAKGLKTKTGEDYRAVWAKMVNAKEDLLEAFDHDVATYRLEYNIQPVF